MRIKICKDVHYTGNVCGYDDAIDDDNGDVDVDDNDHYIGNANNGKKNNDGDDFGDVDGFEHVHGVDDDDDDDDDQKQATSIYSSQCNHHH